jgi:hypothetical protein
MSSCGGLAPNIDSISVRPESALAVRNWTRSSTIHNASRIASDQRDERREEDHLMAKSGSSIRCNRASSQGAPIESSRLDIPLLPNVAGNHRNGGLVALSGGEPPLPFLAGPSPGGGSQCGMHWPGSGCRPGSPPVSRGLPALLDTAFVPHLRALSPTAGALTYAHVACTFTPRPARGQWRRPGRATLGPGQGRRPAGRQSGRPPSLRYRRRPARSGCPGPQHRK